MSYTKHNFQPGGTIQAAPFNSMEDQIALNEADIASLDERVQALESAPVGPGGTSSALYVDKHPVYDNTQGSFRIVPSFLVFNGTSAFSIPPPKP